MVPLSLFVTVGVDEFFRLIEINGNSTDFRIGIAEGVERRAGLWRIENHIPPHGDHHPVGIDAPQKNSWYSLALASPLPVS